MYQNLAENQSNQSKSELFFDSNITPFISLINHLFNKNNNIELLEEIKTTSNNILESRKARFVYTKNEFVYNISKTEDEWLIHFQLNGSNGLTNEEKDICKYYMKELNSLGFCFYIDNEDDTFNFDAEMYEIEPTNSFRIQDEYWKNITKKMNDLAIPDNIKQRIRVQRTQLEKKYGKDNYKPYFDTYFANQLKKFNGTVEQPSTEIKEAITLSSNKDCIWDEITKKMKELKMPAKLMNRIRVQRWHLINKYGDDYINYISDYAQKQFNDFINSKN